MHQYFKKLKLKNEIVYTYCNSLLFLKASYSPRFLRLTMFLTAKASKVLFSHHVKAKTTYAGSKKSVFPISEYLRSSFCSCNPHKDRCMQRFANCYKAKGMNDGRAQRGDDDRSVKNGQDQHGNKHAPKMDILNSSTLSTTLATE
jgi:hypothetical protein